MPTFSARTAIQATINEIYTGTSSPGVRNLRIPELALVKSYADSGSDALIAFEDTQSGIGASVSTDYDLIGTLADKEGNVLNFDLVYELTVYNRSTSYGINVGPKATNSWGVAASNEGFWADASDRSYVPPGGVLFLRSKNGVPATATTDLLQIITNSGSSSNGWTITIVGRDNA